MSNKSPAELLAEASVLAERINRDRAEGKVPEACETVALTEILEILFSELDEAA
jgi:hypothetical protein